MKDHQGEQDMSDETLNLYVAPDGNDHWSGSIPMASAEGTDGPMASVAGARDVIRRLRSDGALKRGVAVHIQAGVYAMAGTLTFTPEDSGTVDAPVRYIAAEGSAPVLSGGRTITGWRETHHAGLRGWIADLPEVAAGQWNFTRLYVNGTQRQRPRLPKTGFNRFTGVAGCADSGSTWCQGPDRANFAPGDIRKWHNWEHVDLISYQLWFDTHHRFKAIDEAGGVAHFHAKSLGSLKDERGEFARYFVENVFEALDTPGQWYLDRSAGRITYLPLPDEKLETTVIVAPCLTELVRLQGEGTRRVAHIHFENLVFAHQHWELPPNCPGYIQAAYGVPGAIILEGAESCVFYGCTIAHVNGYGFEVLAGSTLNTLAACVVHDAGGGGIKIGHEQLLPHQSQIGKEMTGDIPALATTVVDCIIRDCGLIYPSAIGIWIGNSGWNRLVHNRIFNCHYTGISCGWTWGYAPTRTVCNRIERNHIHHINHHEILSDNGGIYTLGQQPGTVLRGNVIHDISCYGYGAWGIYPDEGSSEMRVEHNLVCGTKKAAYATHYGRDNLVQHNIFALSQADHLCLGKRERHRSTVFRHNMCVFANGRVQGGVWDVAHDTASDNLFWSLDGSPLTFNGRSLSVLYQQGQSKGSMVADPLFTDAVGGDFSLRPDTPAKSVGFRPFDWQAGPRLNSDRPVAYLDYVRRFALPALDVPVVRTLIELVTPIDDVTSTGCAVFAVTLSNIGRATGQGAVRLGSGPKGGVGTPSLRRMAFLLEPGALVRQEVTVKIRRGTMEFWLESEPSNAVAVPARCLVMTAARSQWAVMRTATVQKPEAIGQTLVRSKGRLFRIHDRVIAEVKLGASEDGLLIFARIHEPALRPDLVQPWLGTGVELLVIPMPSPGLPAGQAPSKRQVFLIPRAEGRGADALRLAPVGEQVEPAPEIRLCALPLADGCEMAAVIPWSEFGSPARPAELVFELIVDAVDPATGAITQVLTFDMPWNGSVRSNGKLVIVNP
jgi:hypothetical protein